MPDSKNSKISELTELTTPVGDDIVPIVDSSDAETKKITCSNLFKGFLSGNNDWTGTNTFSGNNSFDGDVTITQNTPFGDVVYAFDDTDGFTMTGSDAVFMANNDGLNITGNIDGGSVFSTSSFRIDPAFEAEIPTINEIKTTVTSDDKKMSTSAAVVRYVAGRHPITEFTGTNYETAAKYTDTLNALPSFDIEAVRIGSEVTSLSNTLFRANNTLKYLDAGTVGNIPSRSFESCLRLEEVDIAFTNNIGSKCFLDCAGLTRINLGAIKFIQESCFEDCVSLESITIPQTCVALAGYVFRGCTSLTEINCYTTYGIFNGPDVLLNTSTDMVINVREGDSTWTPYIGEDQNLFGNPSVSVRATLF